MNQEKTEKKSFNFNKGFQRKIAKALVEDKKWAAQISEVLEVDYFELKPLKAIISQYIDFFKKYNHFPTNDVLHQIVVDKFGKSTNQAQNEAISLYVKEFIDESVDYGDLAFVKESALAFCKKAAMQKALQDCVVALQSEDDNAYEKIHEHIKKAMVAGTDNSVGHNLEEDVLARYVESARTTVPTGVMELDQKMILNGGLGNGEIGIVVAPSGHGKSHWLVHFGASAMRQGFNVVHYTFELNECVLGIRYDSHLCNINSIECSDKKEEIQKFYEENKDKLGKLRIKYYPTGTASVATIRAHLEKLLITQGFKPDLIIIDYAGIMRSTERFDLLRLELKKILEELRGLAGELSIPIWTALQSNKEGVNADVIDITNLAEGFSQAHIADFILGFNRPSKEKATGIGNVFIAKNRAGIDGIQYIMKLDTGRSKVSAITDPEEVAKFNPELGNDAKRSAVREDLADIFKRRN